MPDFSPTPAQRRLLDLMHEQPAVATTTALCQATGVPRATFYRWCKDPGFCRWLGSAWASRLLIEAIPLINLARSLAPEKFPYFKVVYDLTFDPKGLGLLASWQSHLAQMPADAFLPAPESARTRCPESDLRNESVTADNETLRPRFSDCHPRPGQAARAVARALRRLGSQLSLRRSQPPDAATLDSSGANAHNCPAGFPGGDDASVILSGVSAQLGIDGAAGARAIGGA